jgi:hypothetical protein
MDCDLDYYMIAYMRRNVPIYIGWKSIHKRYKACLNKCKHMKGKSKQSHNISNEVENVMLKGHPLPQIN